MPLVTLALLALLCLIFAVMIVVGLRFCAGREPEEEEEAGSRAEAAGDQTVRGGKE